MKLILAFVAITVVAIAIFLLLRRKAKKNKLEQARNESREEAVALRPSRNLAPAPEPATPARAEAPIRPESIASQETLARTAQETPPQTETTFTREPSVAEAVAEKSAELTLQGSISQASIAAKTEPVPEDSVLKRHYHNAREAEKLAIANPFPTDSILRRHYQGMLAQLLKDGGCVSIIAAAEQVEPARMAVKFAVPQDSVQKRHFLMQLQTEIEQRLFPRPQDSILKRHYENLVKTKMAECLPECSH